MNNDPIFLRIFDLMKQQGKSSKDISEALGLIGGIFLSGKTMKKENHIYHGLMR